MQPKYPIYIISKGRADSRLTVKTLEAMNCPYTIVIEESEYPAYSAVIDPKNILVLPEGFRDNPKWAHRCEVTGHLGGSIPVRNFVWEHSRSNGDKRHWILDDNILHFYRLHQNKKVKVTDATGFRVCEDFADRYEDVNMFGMNYAFFAPATTKRPPYYHNTRVYSCICLSNDLYPEISWRGRYNEDTDLSLKVMKAGYHTFLFNAFLCGKVATMTMKGGNTAEVYGVDKMGGSTQDAGGENYDNRLVFAQSLKDQHPDVVHITQKWGRYHHHVDYRVFQKGVKPTLKEGLNIPKGPDNYGLKLVRIKPEDNVINEMEEANEE
jgi:hypothetical protein